MFVAGGKLEHPMESIRLYSLCKALRWAHLPVVGGLYDQDPKMLDQWAAIFTAEADEAERERKKQEAKNARMNKPGGRRRR